jgi:hypothetical protein
MTDDAVTRAYFVWVRAGRPRRVNIRWWHCNPETRKRVETIRIEQVTHTSIRKKAEQLLQTGARK